MDINLTSLGTSVSSQAQALSNYGADLNIIKSTVSTFSSIEENVRNFFPKPILENENKISVAPKEETDKQVTEPKKPVLPSGTEKSVPTDNRPTTPPIAVGMCTANTIIGTMNSTVKYNCDFTIDLKLNVCKKTFTLIKDSFKKTLDLKIEAIIQSQFPFLATLKQYYETIKGYYDYVMKYVKMITGFIKCMIDIVGSIAAFLTKIATLPIDILAQAFGCLNNIRNVFVNSVNNIVDSISLNTKTQTNVSEETLKVKEADSSLNKSVDDYYNEYSAAIGDFLPPDDTAQITAAKQQNSKSSKTFL